MQDITENKFENLIRKASNEYESMDVKEEIIDTQETEIEKIKQASNEYESMEIKDEILEIPETYEYNSQPSSSEQETLTKYFSYLPENYDEYSSETNTRDESEDLTKQDNYITPDFESITSNPTDIKQEIYEEDLTDNITLTHDSPDIVKQEIFENSDDNFENSYNTPSCSNLVISAVKSQVILCCVQKCLNSSETPDIQMYREFPRDSEIFIKWCFNLKIDPRNYKDNQYAICQQHFETICFNENLSLQPWSVPTLNLNLQENSFIHHNDPPQHLIPSEQCIVYGCINPLKPLYKFPINQDISLKWFSNLKLDYTDFRAQTYRICKRHFSSTNFEDTNKLKLQAIPTLYLGHSDKILYLNPLEDVHQDQESLPLPPAAPAAGQDNSRGSSQGSLIRHLVSPHDLEDHDSSYYEDFEEYYGPDE